MTANSIITSAPLLPNEADAIRQARQEVIQSLIINSCTRVVPDQPTITIGGIGAFPLSNLSAIKAKQKQGKTTALTVIASTVLLGECFRLQSQVEEPSILWIDTEQSDYDSRLIIDRISTLTDLADDYIDEHLHLLNLRRFSPEDRLVYLKEAINVYHPQMVIVDGVVDLLNDFNDLASSKILVNELLCLCSEHRAALIAVLHTNKGTSDHEMRGHLGTIIAQKSATVLECEKEENIITVRCTDSRHALLPTFHLRFDDFGNICEGDLAYAQLQESKSLDREAKKAEIIDERKTILLGILAENGGSMLRKDLVEEGMKKLDKSYGTISNLLKQLKTEGNTSEANGSVFIQCSLDS